MASIFENVYNTFNNLKNKAQTGIQNWAQTNPQQATRIINAPKQIAQTYQKVSPYVPFAPKVNTPQQIQQNKERMYQAVNRFQPVAPTKNVTQNILSTPYNFVAGLSNQLIYNPKTRQTFPSSPIRQLPNQQQILNMAKNRDIQRIVKAWAPSTYSVGAGFVLGGSGVKSNRLLNVGDIKEIGAIANRASKNWMTETGKADIAQMTKDENLVNVILSNKYKAPVSELKKIPLVKKINTLFGIGMEDYRGAPKIQPGLSTKPLGGAVQVGGKTLGEIPPQELDPVQKIINAIRTAKPIRGQQEALYTAERGKRIGQFAQIGQNVSGEKGFYQQLGAMKGELPKVQYETLRKSVDQPTIDALFDKVKTSSVLTDFEKVTTGNALSKLLGEKGTQVPTENELSLLNDVFGEQFTKAILDKRPLFKRLLSEAQGAINLPRSLMATADLSAPLRQGMFLIGRPKQWVPAFKEMFKAFGSEDAYKAINENIQKMPTYQIMRENKLALTDIGNNLTKREEAFMSTLAEKIPLIGKLTRASNRAYSGFLNKLRADTFNSIYKGALESGALKDNPKLVSDLANFVNTATGRGSLGGTIERMAPILNAALFSPRLMASRLKLLNPVYYARLDPFVRKEALKSLITFAGTGLTVLGLSKLAGANVSVDPRNSDFGKIKVGNTRYDIWGGFQQYIKLAAQLVSGQMISSTTGKEYTLGEGYGTPTRLDIVNRFVESKQAPILSFAQMLLTNKDFMGNKPNYPAEAINRLIPMVISDIYDITKEKESFASGLLMGIPGLFGVGLGTYGKQTPNLTTTPNGKTKIETKPVTGLGEDIVNAVTGKKATNIPERYQQPLVNVRSRQTQIDIFKDKIKTLSPEEKRDYILKSLKNGTVTREDLIKIINKKSTGTAEGTATKFLESQSKGERATYVKSLISGKSPEEKLSIVKNLIKKGIVDKEVLMLLKEGKNNSPQIVNNSTTRESEGFPFPDYPSSSPGQNLRADLNLVNNTNSPQTYNIVFHMKSPSGKIINVPQTTETITPGQKQPYGIETIIPQDAELGDWTIWVTINGQELSETRKLHPIVRGSRVNRYK